MPLEPYEHYEVSSGIGRGHLLASAHQICAPLLRLTAVTGQIQVTQEELSAMVGMSRATFRRAFSALIDQGIVEIKYGSIVVQDRAALEIEALKTED